MPKNILVVGEIKDGGLRKTSLEGLGAARSLAAKTGAGVVAALVGSGLDAAASELAACGASIVYAIDDPAYSTYSCEAYTEALERLVRDKGCDVVLFSDTSIGKDLAGAVAVRLDAALATDVVEMDVADGGYLRVVHPIFTGKVNAEFVLQKKAVQVVSIRPNLFPAASPGRCARKGREVRLETREAVAHGCEGSPHDLRRTRRAHGSRHRRRRRPLAQVG
jgi:electron transfer flavoprotein alpha subunit